MSEPEYEVIDDDYGWLINQKNLNRFIRARHIVKRKFDVQHNLEKGDLNKFKKERRKDEDNMIKVMSKLPPPSFLKTKFKTRTVEKFRIVNGHYMGVKV